MNVAGQSAVMGQNESESVAQRTEDELIDGMRESKEKKEETQGKIGRGYLFCRCGSCNDWKGRRGKAPTVSLASCPRRRQRT